jgi:hypothetical protein
LQTESISNCGDEEFFIEEHQPEEECRQRIKLFSFVLFYENKNALKNQSIE